MGNLSLMVRNLELGNPYKTAKNRLSFFTNNTVDEYRLVLALVIPLSIPPPIFLFLSFDSMATGRVLQ